MRLSLKTLIVLVSLSIALNSSMANGADKIVFSSNEFGNYDIFMINPDGTGKTRLTDSPVDEVSPRISHDGKTIAFTRFDGGQYHGNIYFYDVATQQITQITTSNDVAYDLSWSPDDTKIAYSANCGNRQIAVLDLAGGTVSFPGPCGNVYGAIWHPSDGGIYYWEYLGYCYWGMNSISANGGTPQRTDNWAFHDEGWAFNPLDPNQVAACMDSSTNCTHNTALALVDRAVGTFTKVHGGETVSDRSPSWSPDGSRIAFISGPLGSVHSIMVYNVSLGNAVEIANTNPADITDLSWGAVINPIVDSVYFPSITDAPCDYDFVRQPVIARLNQPAKSGLITFRVPAGVTYQGIDRTGLITAGWDYVAAYPHLDSGYVIVQLANTLGSRLPADTATLFYVEFYATRLCRTDNVIHWDTAQSAVPSRRTSFVDTLYATIVPGFDRLRDSTVIKGYEPGDVDGNGGVDIADLTALIDHLFIGFSPLCVSAAANVAFPLTTGVDIADLTMLIDNLFVTFASLECGSSATLTRTVVDDNYRVVAELVDGQTIISVTSPVELKGIELTMTGPTGSDPIKLISGALNVYSGWQSDHLRIGLVDPTGNQSIPAGSTALLRLDGDYHVVTAVLADHEYRSVHPAINGGAAALPTAFALHQNYPNPFNPTTTISFALPHSQRVTLEVFNLLGQSVAVLLDNEMDAGQHQVVWDGNDNSGQSVSSGIYLYRLTAGEAVETKKMMLMK